MLDRVDWMDRVAVRDRSLSRGGCLAVALGLHATALALLLWGRGAEVPPVPLTPAAAVVVMDMEIVRDIPPEAAGVPAIDGTSGTVETAPPEIAPTAVAEAVAAPVVDEVGAPPAAPPPPPARPAPARPAVARSPPRPAVARAAPATPAAAPAMPPVASQDAPAVAMASNAAPNWRGEVMARLLRAKRYPEGARSRGEQGTAYATFTLDREGHVLSTSLVRGSGSYQLDAEAVALIRRAEPLPPVPVEMAGATVTLTVPVAFALR